MGLSAGQRSQLETVHFWRQTEMLGLVRVMYGGPIGLKCVSLENI